MPDWYYVTDGEKAGPIEQAALMQLFAQGTLAADTLIWQEGLENWTSANALPAFLAPAPVEYVVTPVVPKQWTPTPTQKVAQGPTVPARLRPPVSGPPPFDPERFAARYGPRSDAPSPSAESIPLTARVTPRAILPPAPPPRLS